MGSHGVRETTCAATGRVLSQRHDAAFNLFMSAGFPAPFSQLQTLAVNPVKVRARALGAQGVDHGPQLEQAIDPVLLDMVLGDPKCHELVEGWSSSISRPCGQHLAISGIA
jgi:hypothetical protein